MKKQVIILRGMSGSGKSTLALQLISLVPGAAVHSTSYYFYTDGRYEFDPTKLHPHHQSNQAAFHRSCARGLDLVICDNTNTRLREIQPYLNYAWEFNYSITILTLPILNITLAQERNHHSVPYEILRKQQYNLCNYAIVEGPGGFSEVNLKTKLT